MTRSHVMAADPRRRRHVRLRGRTIFRRTQYGNWYLIMPRYTVSSHIVAWPWSSRRKIRVFRRPRNLQDWIRSG